MPIFSHTSCFFIIILAIISLIEQAKAVIITMNKGNIYIENNSNYTFKIEISQSKSQINPLKVQLLHQINNSLATTNQYFDYFKYLSRQDILCYNYSIGNSSYLFPCPFLLNNNTVLRVSSITDAINSNDQQIKGLNEIDEHFIVDNTPYPFPEGAYPYSSISITSSTTLYVYFSDMYKNAGIRLIFINVTLILVYLFIILVLIYRTRKILEEMKMKVPDFNMKKRVSEISRQDKDITEEDEESDIDNYEQIVAKDFSLRESKISKSPSLLSSSVEDKQARIMMKIENEKSK